MTDPSDRTSRPEGTRSIEAIQDDFRSRDYIADRSVATAVFLVDGAVAGTWRHEKGRIEIKPFGDLSTTARREVDDEAERLAAFLAG